MPKKKKETFSYLRNHTLDLAQKYSKMKNSYIKNGVRMCRCISCGVEIPITEAEGGHFVSRTVHITELEEDNINPQCHRCNGFLSGNYLNYRYFLVRKIGEDRVKRLEYLAHASRGDKYAIDHLSEEDKILLDEKKGMKYYRDKKSILKKRCDDIEFSWGEKDDEA